MQKAERAVGGPLLLPVAARLLQQYERAHHIRLHKGARAIDAAVHVRLGGQMHHPHRLMLIQ